MTRPTASSRFVIAAAPGVPGRLLWSSVRSSATFNSRAVASARSAWRPIRISMPATRGGTALSRRTRAIGVRGRAVGPVVPASATDGTQTSLASVPRALDTV